MTEYNKILKLWKLKNKNISIKNNKMSKCTSKKC